MAHSIVDYPTLVLDNQVHNQAQLMIIITDLLIIMKRCDVGMTQPKIKVGKRKQEKASNQYRLCHRRHRLLLYRLHQMLTIKWKTTVICLHYHHFLFNDNKIIIRCKILKIYTWRLLFIYVGGDSSFYYFFQTIDACVCLFVGYFSNDNKIVNKNRKKCFSL